MFHQSFQIFYRGNKKKKLFFKKKKKLTHVTCSKFVRNPKNKPISIDTTESNNKKKKKETVYDNCNSIVNVHHN